MNTTLTPTPNLTQRPPRSPRVRLGGYVLLPRLLDKGRAELSGTAGEYKYNNPIDRHWFRFTGITPEALKAELAKAKGDGEILTWVQENAPQKREAWEIQHWSTFHNERGPDGDVETLEFFAGRVGGLSQTREESKPGSITWTSTITSALAVRLKRPTRCNSGSTQRPIMAECAVEFGHAIELFCPFMSKPACPMCEMTEVLDHPEKWECVTCGHEWPHEAAPEVADGPRVVKDAHGNVLADGDCVVLIKDLKLGGGNQVLKGGSKSKPIRLVDGDHEIDCKVDGMSIALKACFVKKV